MFEANFSSTDLITNNKTISTKEKFEQLMAQVVQYTGLVVHAQIAQLFAFDALILNEDRHTNTFYFFTIQKKKRGSWRLFSIIISIKQSEIFSKEPVRV
ncbi:hypothetical protein ACFVT8_09585 [Lysinibacillus sp. NPDC058147]|uniref:hypothetical protein n=1 Tax=unclassified Lysinibacillus TaxID=2636778 RepID=UPI0036DBB731